MFKVFSSIENEDLEKALADTESQLKEFEAANNNKDTTIKITSHSLSIAVKPELNSYKTLYSAALSIVYEIAFKLNLDHLIK